MSKPAWAIDMPVIDNTDHRVTINVRRIHIADAVSQNGATCVAARCTVMALDAAGAYFYRSKAYILWDEGDAAIVRYHLSAALVRDVIVPLDDGRPGDCKPGLYELLPVPPGQRLGVKRGPRPDAPERKKPGRKVPRRVIGRMSAYSKTKVDGIAVGQ